MKEQRKNDRLAIIWLLIWFAWFLDILTSYIGITVGIREGSALFLLFPLMWPILLMGLSSFVYFFRAAPGKLRKIILLGIVLGSFVPMFRNLIVIYQMVIA